MNNIKQVWEWILNRFNFQTGYYWDLNAFVFGTQDIEAYRYIEDGIECYEPDCFYIYFGPLTFYIESKT